MYEIYQKLLDIKHLKNSDVSRGTGVSNMTLSDWKNGKTTPKTETMQKIADFLEVSVDYLMTGKEPSESKYSTEMAHLVSKIRNDAELSKALLLYFDLPENKKKHVVDTIKILSEVWLWYWKDFAKYKIKNMK